MTLYDSDQHTDHIVGVGHGGDDADTLLDLWTTLIDRDERSEAAAYVAAAYTKRAGKAPARPMG